MANKRPKPEEIVTKGLVRRIGIETGRAVP